MPLKPMGDRGTSFSDLHATLSLLVSRDGEKCKSYTPWITFHSPLVIYFLPFLESCDSPVLFSHRFLFSLVAMRSTPRAQRVYERSASFTLQASSEAD
jgi:hypothetical protein